VRRAVASALLRHVDVGQVRRRVVLCRFYYAAAASFMMQMLLRYFFLLIAAPMPAFTPFDTMFESAMLSMMIY